MACNWPHMPPACGCPVSTLHDTTTLTDEGAAILAAHPEPAARLSIERLLELRSIAFDVATEHLTESAAEAASDAIAAAEALSVPDTHIATVTQAPERNRVLSYAGDVIRARGWVQRDWVAEDGAVCLMTAVRIASCGDDSAYADAYALILDRIESEFGQSVNNPAYWNDASGRTVGDVLRILR